MATSTVGSVMAKKKSKPTEPKKMGRPPSDGPEMGTIRCEKKQAHKLRELAGEEGVSIGVIVSRMLQEPLRKAWAEYLVRQGLTDSD